MYDDEFVPPTEEQKEELMQIQREIENEKDPFMRNQLLELYEQPLMLAGLSAKQGRHFDAEAYFENADDIINEEEIEESVVYSTKKSTCKKPPNLLDLEPAQ